MRGGVLPPALLFAALPFALGFAPRRALPAALDATLAAAVALYALPIPQALTEIVFVGYRASVMGTAAMVHLGSGIGLRLAVPLGINAGAWASATVAVSGVCADLVKALPVLLLVLPSQWLVAHRGGIAVKVVASWLVAAAILAATPATVPTPGYVPDHME
jgi:ABC-type proline/glycine betaine transport system permease subunit